MSDRWPASIEIGGCLPKAKIEALATAIMEDGGGLEWGEANNLESLVKAIKKVVKNGNALKIFNDQANAGQFSELESFLYVNKMSYRRHSDAYMEYSSEIVLYYPAKLGQHQIALPSDQNGNPLHSIAWLKACLADGLTLKQTIEQLEAAEITSSMPALQIV